MKNLFLYIPAEKVSSHLFPDIKLELNVISFFFFFFFFFFLKKKNKKKYKKKKN